MLQQIQIKAFGEYECMSACLLIFSGIQLWFKALKITKSPHRIGLIVSGRYHLDSAAFMALDQNERPFSFDLVNSHSAHLLLLRGHKCTGGTADSSLCQANKEQI